MKSCTIAWCLALTLLLAAGCGTSGPARYPVSGTVTFNGQAVPQGQIVFMPSDGSAPPDAGSIVGGKYSLRVSAGKKRVEITADRETGKVDPVMGAAPRESYIPARYNSESTLNVEVTPAGPNQFPFDLTD